MKLLLLAGAALSLLAVAAPPARSQNIGTVAISGDTCPSSTQYPAGNNRPLILTQTGILCTSGTGGGGGGGGAVTGASNSFVDGWNVTGGSTTDVLCPTDDGTCTDIALLKRMNQSLSAVVAAIGSPVPAATHCQTAALAAVLACKASPGTLYSFEVSADSTLSGAAWWVLVFDATSAPADGAVTPVKCYAVPSGTVSMNALFGAGGFALATGVSFAVSTTGCFTKTQSAHAFIAGDYL